MADNMTPNLGDIVSLMIIRETDEEGFFNMFAKSTLHMCRVYDINPADLAHELMLLGAPKEEKAKKEDPDRERKEALVKKLMELLELEDD